MQMPYTLSPTWYGPRARRQRGVYALEWAIIFPVFFILLYAIICYGLTFLVRESMQYAVEEGARAALRYPSSANGSTPPTWTQRRDEARNAVVTALNWLPSRLKPTAATVGFTLCYLNDNSCNSTKAFDPSLSCTASTPCLVLVSYKITNYPSSAIAPAINLPGVRLLLPDILEAKASTLVDRRML
ncbi:pilus assembly protein [Comamonas humi]